MTERTSDSEICKVMKMRRDKMKMRRDKMRKTRSRSLALVSAATLLLSGITISGASSVAGATDSKAPIVIASMSPINGAFYNAPDNLAATKAAIRYVNSHGGIGGRDLKLDWCNEGDSANQEAVCTAGFASSNAIAAVNNVPVFNETVSVSTLVNAKMADIGPAVLNAASFQIPSLFPTDGGNDFQAASTAIYAVKDEHLKRVAMVGNDGSTSFVIAAAVKSAVKAAGGTYLGEVVLPQSNTIPDYSSYAAQVLALHPDVIETPITSLVGVMKAVRGLGSNVPFLTGGAALDGSVLGANQSIDKGALIGNPAPWIYGAAVSPGMKTFLASMNAEAKTGDSAANLAVLTEQSAAWYANVIAVAQVLKQMASNGTAIDRAAFLTAFGNAKNIQTGILPPWTPGDHQTVVTGFSSLSNPDEYILKVENGKAVLANGGKPLDVAPYLKDFVSK